MPKKRTLLFFALVIFAVVLMTYQSKNGSLFTGGFLNYLLNGSHLAVKTMTDGIKRPFERMALREEENVRLKKRLDELLSERSAYQEAVYENKRLRDLLKLSEKTRDRVATARVIGRGVDSWTHTLVLDKGQKDGVDKDMTAVTPLGLAGKITNVSDSYAYLLLVTNINFSVAVRFQESRAEGVLSGTGTRKCILKYVPDEEEVKTGDIVITSGLDLLFPPGIRVGYVSKVDNKGRGGNFQYIEVVPFQDDTRIEEVLIVRAGNH